MDGVIALQQARVAGDKRYARVSALPLSSGTDDTSAVNTILATAGIVRGVPGQNYLISSPLVVPSNTTLDLTGCTVTVKTGSACNHINNAAVTPTASANDAAVTSGSNVVTTSLSASASVGQTLVVAGAGAGGNGPLVGNIIAVGSGTVTLSKLDNVTAANATATVSAAAVSLYNRNKNVKIKGGTWNRQSGVGGSGNTAHMLRFRHVDGLEIDVEGGNSTDGKYFLSYSDISDFRIKVKGLNVHSDGVHGNGPLLDGRIGEVVGTTGDDCNVLIGNDWTGYNDCAGDIINVETGVTYTVGGGVNGLKIIAGAGCFVGNITSRAVRGWCTQNGVWIGDDGSSANTTGGTYGDIDAGKITVTCGGTYTPLILFTPAADSIKASIVTPNCGFAAKINGTSNSAVLGKLDLTITVPAAYNYSGGAGVSHNPSGGYTIREFILNDCYVASGVAFGALLTTSGTSAIDQCVVRNCTQRGINGTAVILHQGTSVLRSLVFQGGYYTNLSQVLYSRSSGWGSSTYVSVIGSVLSGASRIADIRVACTTYFLLDGPYLASLANAAFYTSTATYVIDGWISTSGAFTMLQRAGSESVTSLSDRLPFDLATLTRTAGARANNTNASLACGVGPAICDPSGSTTNWKNTYSGATY